MRRHNPPQRALRTLYSQDQRFLASDEPDFTKIVLGWSISMIHDELSDSRYKIPANASSVVNFYRHFKPLILEEARAIISDGLKKSSESAMSFSLKLSRDATLPKNEGNPMGLSFFGEIPREIEHSPAMNILLLESAESSAKWIGVANEEIGGERKLLC